MDINGKYQDIISRSKFIAKSDTWYVEGTEAKLVDGVAYHIYLSGQKFSQGWGLFEGWTNESYEGYKGELPRLDGETCQFDEFLIYDELGNEISQSTIQEVISKVRVSKIDKI